MIMVEEKNYNNSSNRDNDKYKVSVRFVSGTTDEVRFKDYDECFRLYNGITGFMGAGKKYKVNNFYCMNPENIEKVTMEEYKNNKWCICIIEKEDEKC